MSDARNVYIILFVMLLLPIVFYMLRRRYRTHDTKKKMRCLVYMVVMIIAAGGLCFGLYSHTIHTEPLLVAEQTAGALYQAETAGQEAAAALKEKGLLEDSGRVQQMGTGNWADYAGAAIGMPDKSIELDNGKYYPIVLEKQDTKLCLAMKITKNKTHTKASDIVILWPEEIGEKLDSITFFDSGNLPQ